MGQIDTVDRRTDVVFLLFNYGEEVAGVTKLQKLLFLVEEESAFFEAYRDDVGFKFAPYKMGPFSEHVYEELQFLLTLDAIETTPLPDAPTGIERDDLSGQRFTITPKGRKIATELESQLEPKFRYELTVLVEEYNDYSLTELLEYVYSEYPEYAAESEIIDQLNVSI
jgi:hypothetical protein